MEIERFKVLRTLLRDETPLYIKAKAKAKKSGYRSTSHTKTNIDSGDRYVKIRTNHSQQIVYPQISNRVSSLAVNSESSAISDRKTQLNQIVRNERSPNSLKFKTKEPNASTSRLLQPIDVTSRKEGYQNGNENLIHSNSSTLLPNPSYMIRRSHSNIRSKLTDRSLRPYECTDNQVIKSINKEQTQTVLKEITQEYKELNARAKKKEVQEHFLKKLMSSSRTYEQFGELNSKRQRINNMLSNEFRERNAENTSKNQKQWISPLSVYKQSAFTKLSDRQQRSDVGVNQYRPKLLAGLANREDELPELTDKKLADSARQKKTPQPFAYDTGTFLKYMLEFIHLSRISNEIDNIKTLGDAELDEQSFTHDNVQSQIQNILLMNKVTTPTDIFHSQKDMQKYLKEHGVYLCVLKEHYAFIFKERKLLSTRILLALNCNPDKEFFKLDWEMYLKFCKTLVYYDSPRSELTKFILKFFKLNDSVLASSSAKATLRILCQEVDKNLGTELYERFIENWQLAGIIMEDSPYINIENLMLAYSTGKLDMYQLLDLITHKIS